MSADAEIAARLELPGGKRIEIVGPGDITTEETDAIVNAANSSLLGGGGVDGAIHRTGGPAILAECRQIVAKIGSLAPGKAVITTGGRLKSRHVIHTVGPIYHGGERDESELLASCHRESIRLADQHQLASIAFPAISAGAYGYPVAKAAPVALSSSLAELQNSTHVKLVRFVLFDVVTVKAYATALKNLGEDRHIPISS